MAVCYRGYHRLSTEACLSWCNVPFWTKYLSAKGQLHALHVVAWPVFGPLAWFIPRRLARKKSRWFLLLTDKKWLSPHRGPRREPLEQQVLVVQARLWTCSLHSSPNLWSLSQPHPHWKNNTHAEPRKVPFSLTHQSLAKARLWGHVCVHKAFVIQSGNSFSIENTAFKIVMFCEWIFYANFWCFTAVRLTGYVRYFTFQDTHNPSLGNVGIQLPSCPMQ